MQCIRVCGRASEMCWRSMEFDMQGCTLTCTHTMKLSCRPTDATSKNFSQIMLPLDTGQSSNLIKSFGRSLQGMLDLPLMMLSQTSHSFLDCSIQSIVHGSLEGREVIPKSATSSIWGLH